LAKHQLQTSSQEEEEGESTQQGMSHALLFQKACEHLFVTNQVTFKTLLGEFKDHKVFVTRKTSEGEALQIPLDAEHLKFILDELKLA
jgi:hypothetical protein